MKKIISKICFLFLVACAVFARPNPNGNPAPAAPAMRNYNVTIYCTEQDARVQIDGQLYGYANKTYNIKQGGHTLLVTKAGFVDYEYKFILDRDMTITANLYRPGMKPQPPMPPVKPVVREYKLTVNSSEPDCKVYLNENYLGLSNKTYKVKEGSYIVKVEKDGLEAKEGVTLDSDKSIFIKLVPQAAKEFDLVISTSEPDCSVYLNETLLGPSNKSYKVKEGSYIIKAVKNGFKDAKEGVTVDSNKSVFLRMEKEFKPQEHQRPPVSHRPGVKTHDLTVRCEDWDATVYIDGVDMGRPNQTFKVEDGNHKIVVSRHGFESFEMLISCDTDRTVEAKLKPRRR